jgi:hypothetical protein
LRFFRHCRYVAGIPATERRCGQTFNLTFTHAIRPAAALQRRRQLGRALDVPWAPKPPPPGRSGRAKVQPRRPGRAIAAQRIWYWHSSRRRCRPRPQTVRNARPSRSPTMKTEGAVSQHRHHVEAGMASLAAAAGAAPTDRPATPLITRCGAQRSPRPTG